MKDQEQLLDDIVSMLDNAMNNGVGHMDIKIDKNQNINKKIETMGCTDCASGDLACSIPTLHEGLDIPDEKLKEEE